MYHFKHYFNLTIPCNEYYCCSSHFKIEKTEIQRGEVIHSRWLLNGCGEMFTQAVWFQSALRHYALLLKETLWKSFRKLLSRMISPCLLICKVLYKALLYCGYYAVHHSRRECFSHRILIPASAKLRVIIGQWTTGHLQNTHSWGWLSWWFSGVSQKYNDELTAS